MKQHPDIDIDIGNRDILLSHIEHIPAAMRKVQPVRKHNSGIHVTDIPHDPLTNMAAIDYTDADARGYFKLDILNMHLYQYIRDEDHLLELMKDPDWRMLNDRDIVQSLVHLTNSYNILVQMPEQIDSIPRLAMFLAVIRPAKRHLVGLTWKEINDQVWDKDEDGGYVFRKCHAVAYAQLIVIHMNLIRENAFSAANILPL